MLKNRNIAIFCVFRLDNGVSVWYNVRGGYKGDACSAHHTSKQKEGLSMSYTSQYFKDRANKERANKERKIAEGLFSAGIIESPMQKSISSESAIYRAVAEYQRQLQVEKDKDSTGTVGKFCDVADRVLMNLHRDHAIPVSWFACRGAGQADITVYIDDEKTADAIGKTRVNVEGKTGAGVLAAGADIAECYDLLSDACDAGKWFLWRYDVTNFDPLATDALDEIDYLPHIFLPTDELFAKLESYNGTIDTWLREPNATTVNFQSLKTSAKKRKFLQELAMDSYDWPTFRDYGKLVKQGKA